MLKPELSRPVTPVPMNTVGGAVVDAEGAVGAGALGAGALEEPLVEGAAGAGAGVLAATTVGGGSTLAGLLEPCDPAK